MKLATGFGITLVPGMKAVQAHTPRSVRIVVPGSSVATIARPAGTPATDC